MTKGYSLGTGTVIRFRGKDRCRVVNNLCTQDLRKLSHGQALETFVTDVKGRTFGHGIAVGWVEEILFVTVPDQGAKLVPHFDRYIIREDAQVSDASQEFQFWLFQDRATAATGLGRQLDQMPTTHSAVNLQLHDQAYGLLSAEWIGKDSVLCLAPANASDAPVRDRLGDNWIASDLTRREAWEPDRIAAFWAWYGVDMDDRNLPQEVERTDSAISFNKGCYLGQETIARLDMLGQVQKKLVQLEMDTTVCPEVPSAISADGKDVGTLCSVAQDTLLGKCIGLAYIKRSHFQPGTTVSVMQAKAIVKSRPTPES